MPRAWCLGEWTLLTTCPLPLGSETPREPGRDDEAPLGNPVCMQVREGSSDALPPMSPAPPPSNPGRRPCLPAQLRSRWALVWEPGMTYLVTAKPFPWILSFNPPPSCRRRPQLRRDQAQRGEVAWPLSSCVTELGVNPSQPGPQAWALDHSPLLRAPLPRGSVDSLVAFNILGVFMMGGALETSWSLGGASTGPLSPRSFDPTARLPSARTGAAQLLTALTPGGEPRSLGMLSAKGSVPAL